MCLFQRQILQNDSRNTTALNCHTKFKCYLRLKSLKLCAYSIMRDQSRPRLFLTINTEIMRYSRCFPSKLKIYALWKQSCIITQRNLKLWAFWVICANKPYIYWLFIKPPLLICTRESDPDAG